MGTFRTYDGTELDYRTEGSGRPLICLSGGPRSGAASLGDLGGLSRHRQLVLPDLRGTGGSADPAVADGHRCDRQAHDVEALREHLGLDRIDLLGHAASGAPAVRYAVGYPHRLRSLTLIAPDLRVTSKDARAGITAPVLVLAGELGDGPRPISDAVLAAVFPEAQTVVQRGAGHRPWLDDAGAFTRTVAAFLDPDVRTVRAGDVRLAYRVWGDEHAPPVVLAHGRGGHGGQWTRVAEQLAVTRRVYSPDFRGHGLSEWPGIYGFEAFRDDLSAFVGALDLGRVDVVGHSMGGAAALLLAEQHPRLVRRLVVEEAPPLLPLDPPRPEAEPPAGPLDFDWPVVPDTDAELNEPDPAWWERLTAIEAPTLVIAGGPTSHVPQDRLGMLAARVPDGSLVTIEAGHLVHENRPEEFVAALKSFGL
ncbi:alpha/beta fold hydrolase [Streptomyces sp. NPDC003023]|uniref:alpha/beta fold hydrolase n=1 Tax=Streptomyces sp. NPDC003023 TaxID=3364675 RepID=UPI00367FDFCA